MVFVCFSLFIEIHIKIRTRTELSFYISTLVFFSIFLLYYLQSLPYRAANH